MKTRAILERQLRDELNRMVKKGTVKRKRLPEKDRPKGKRGQPPYVYWLVKREP